jgi:hypothetical protein
MIVLVGVWRIACRSMEAISNGVIAEELESAGDTKTGVTRADKSTGTTGRGTMD